MMAVRSKLTYALIFLALPLLQACGDSGNTTDTTPASDISELTEAEKDQQVDSDEEVVDPDALEPSGQIELKQYTVAYVGSGTVGGGTLTVDGKPYPFKISGLGVGGFGASSIDAEGVVYNLPNIEAFPGTYGNARMGMTAGDSGSGKLWLRSPTGVVIELDSEMRGLALSTGLDGIYIEWDEDGDSTVDQVMDDTEQVVGDGIEKGATAVQSGVDNVKGWLK
ncbi:MAG: hypothetical protein V7746_21965 [Halioglobus sp.]